MKKVAFFPVIIVSLLLTISLHAQYCGTSGSSICTAQSSFTRVGFEPPEDSLPCMIIGQPYSEVIQFHTPSNATVQGTSGTLNYYKIDTINNLPCGICWAMGESNFEINGNSTGCIKLSGTTFDAPGEYKLHIIVDVNITPILFSQNYADQNLSTQGFTYYVRVQLPDDTCAQLDTLVAGNTASHSGTLDALTINGNTGLCPGATTTLTAHDSSAIYAYAWSNGTFNSSITVNSPGTYTVTVYGECTSATASKTVTALAVRDTITASGPTTFCQGGSVTLSVPAGATSYLWSTGASTNSITATTTGNYLVTVTSTNGCSAVSAGQSVTVNALPPDTITATGPLAFCPGHNVILSGPAGLRYQWNNSDTIQNIVVSQSGTYVLIVTNANNCTAISSGVTTTLLSSPSDTITANGPLSFCTGGSVTLSGLPGLAYHWSNGDTSQSIVVTQSGSYTLTVTNAGGCTAVSAPAVVTANGPPLAILNANSPVSFCAGDSIVLTVDPGVTGLAFNWSNGATTQSVTLKQTGTYYVTVTNGNNCSAVSSPFSVTVEPSPSDTVSAGGPTTFCSGSDVVLTAASGSTYRWSNNATTQSITVTQAGTYTVTVTSPNNCNAASIPVQITVHTNPDDTVSVSGPTSFCSGGQVTLTAAPGLTYSWSTSATTQAITVSQTGSYSVTVTNGNNCSAVSPVTNVTVNPTPVATITASGPTSFCQGGSVNLTASASATYLWSNGLTSRTIPVTTSGSYIVTVTSSSQCTAASAPTVVTVDSPTVINTQPASQVSCINGAVVFTVAAGGDSLTYQWQKNGVNISGQTGASYSIPTASYSDTGNYRVVVKGACGTDTSHTASLAVASQLTFSQQPQSQIACQGNSVTFMVIANGGSTTYQWRKNGQNISNATSATYVISNVIVADTGSYSCYVTSNCGDATSDSATLTVKLPSSSSLSQSICTGASYNFNGRELSAAGTYLDTLTNSNGCDSIITLHLTLIPPLTYTYYDTICSGSTYNFNGQNLTAAGVYSDTIITTGGCDSIVTLHLAVKQFSTSNNSASICQGGEYNFDGHTLTTAGTYSDTLSASNGCDSIAYLHLTVNQPTSATISANICPGQHYNFNGHTLTTGGTYLDTLTNAAGCDSFITLHLTNITTITYGYSAAICAGNSYSFNGHVLTSAGVYTDTLQSSGGCDSIVTLHLTVNQPSGSSFSTSVCYGASYSFAGRNLSASGTYFDTLTNHYGCDSIITLNLTVDPAIVTNLHASICSGSAYTFNGQQLTSSGTYHAYLTAQNGCDSTVTLVLHVGTVVTDTFSASVCAGSSYNFNGRNLSQAGSYNDTLIAQGGCDSIVTLQLSVNQPVFGSASVSICNGGSYNFNGRILSSPGTYTDTLPSSTGCDSIVTLTLQTAPYLSTAISAAICQGTTYDFNGQSLGSPGVYYDTLTAQGGCDSIITLTLTVNQTKDTTIYALICAGNTYLFNGIQVGATGTYFEALTGANGCDSIVKLQLTVNTLLTVNPTVHICYGASYNFNGQILDTTGTYVDTLVAQGGCDSAVILNLIVDSLLHTTVYDSICTGGVIHFNGHNLTQAGTYIDTLQSHTGCDSIVTLNLAIKSHSTDTVITTASQTAFCAGDSAQLCATHGYATYVWTNHDTSTCFYTGTAGSYAVTATDFVGCTAASVPIAITVYALPPVSITELVDTLTSTPAVSYQWYFDNQLIAGGTGQALLAMHTGNYFVQVTDSNGCTNTSSIVHVNTAISDINAGYGVKLYPNPGSGYFTLEFSDDVQREVEITDALGRTLMQPIKVERQKNFDLENLPAGVYFMRIRQGEGVRSVEFSVVK